MRINHSSHTRTVVRDNSADLLRFFLRRVENPEDAADLVGATFEALWMRASDLPKDRVEARMWLFGIARNVLLAHRRTSGNTERLSQLLKEQNAAASGTDPHEILDLRHAVRSLPGPKRELILLVHGDGFSLAEAASLLGLNPSTVRSRYAVALAELRTSVAGVSDITTSASGREAAARSDALNHSRNDQSLPPLAAREYRLDSP